MRKPLLVYLFVILTFGAGIYLALEKGKRLEDGKATPASIFQHPARRGLYS